MDDNNAEGPPHDSPTVVWSLDKARAHFDSSKEGKTTAGARPVVTVLRLPEASSTDARWSPAGHLSDTEPRTKTRPGAPVSAAPAAWPDSEPGADRWQCPTLSAGGCLGDSLLLLSDAYRAVRALASESADLCSLPTLTQHASVTLLLLAGLYLSIAGSRTASVATFSVFALFLLMNGLRLLAVSSMGSRVQTSGEALSAALVATRWRRPMTAQLQFEALMLVEHTAKPLAFDGYGIFVPQKETMLSLLSFILTYFVIMVQVGL